MAGKTKKRSTSKAGTTPKVRPGTKARSTTTESPVVVGNEPRFVQDLRVRGEVAKLTPDGKLPLDATHLEVDTKGGGTVIKRARFKLV
jgi:hypothetical protein